LRNGIAVLRTRPAIAAARLAAGFTVSFIDKTSPGLINRRRSPLRPIRD
jgi:hypothetical protein